MRATSRWGKSGQKRAQPPIYIHAHSRSTSSWARSHLPFLYLRGDPGKNQIFNRNLVMPGDSLRDFSLPSAPAAAYTRLTCIHVDLIPCTCAYAESRGDKSSTAARFSFLPKPLPPFLIYPHTEHARTRAKSGAKNFRALYASCICIYRCISCTCILYGWERERERASF